MKYDKEIDELLDKDHKLMNVDFNDKRRKIINKHIVELVRLQEMIRDDKRIKRGI